MSAVDRAKFAVVEIDVERTQGITRILSELLLFSFLAAFVTGIVLAAAKQLI
jgi:hypothetical protein